MTFSGPIEDRILIRELIETYNDAVFRRDADLWGGLWADEAHWHIFGQEIKGRENILTMWTQAMQTFSYVGFFASPGTISVSGEDAMARVYVQETLVKDEQLQSVQGRYDDDLIKISGKWLFKSRRYEVLFDSNNLRG